MAADKHATSAAHKHAMLMAELGLQQAANSRGNVAQQCQAFATRQSISDMAVVHKLFHAAYFVFTNEIVHTTN